MGMTDEVTYIQKSSPEEVIYSQLVALYLDTEEKSYVSQRVWELANALLQRLAAKDPEYNAFLLVSDNAAQSIPGMTFKQQLRTAIAMLGTQEGLEDLSDIIRRNRQDGGMHVSATANPTQTNHQEVKVTVEQRVEMVVKEIEDNLPDDQVAEIKPLLDDYKKKPTRSATENLLRGILGLGTDIAVGVIANIISKQLGI